MTGTASRKEKRAAARGVRPRARPAVIVTPDRDAPGTRARAWAHPMSTAPRMPRLSALRVPEPQRSAASRARAKTRFASAMTAGVRRCSSTASPARRPAAPTGTVAAITIHPRWLSGAKGRARRAERSQPPATSRRSRRRYAATAASEPTCTATSKARPWSGQPSRAGTRMRCAELEIGRNSVSPWTRARTMAWVGSMTAAAAGSPAVRADRRGGARRTRRGRRPPPSPGRGRARAPGSVPPSRPAG